MTKPNRLIDEKSPYLLQHAHNPVDWYPWGEEAFARARAEDKPIFLSIGYSTCHWCHVMAHESFEDEDVARLLNDNFVCIKVDREERPDIDNVYMTVCQMLNGHGGWPLTIFMAPDKRPFYAATYIPKHERFGSPGLMEFIPRIGEVWTDDREGIMEAAGRITEALRTSRRSMPGGELDESVLSKCFDELRHRFDTVYGGFGESPKFPSPHIFLFLLRWHARSGDRLALDMTDKSLRAMRLGGMYDHLGSGFHRYSTDREWLLPHFEKMLYDQAMLAMAYTEAFQATGDPFHRKVAEEIFAYVRRDMTHPDGGFYSAEDADSEGVEGKFYVWTTPEVRDILGPDLGNFFITTFNLTDEGNFEDEASGRRTGANIPHLDRDFPLYANPEDTARLDEARRLLFEAREKRVHPHKDDKVLTDWNGLMIAALAKAARAFGEPRLADEAGRAAGFVLSRLRDSSGRLLHRWREGEAAVPALLDDYAFLAWGLVELFEATYRPEHLRTAMELCREMIDKFWDAEAGGLYFTAEGSEDVLIRQKDIYDGAVPSGNSAAMYALLRLGRLTGDTPLEAHASEIAKTFAGEIAGSPSIHTMMLCGLDFALGPTVEVVIAGDPAAADTGRLIDSLRSGYRPRAVSLLKAPGDEALPSIAGFIRDLEAQEGKATAYVCRNFACERPTTDPGALREMLGEG